MINKSGKKMPGDFFWENEPENVITDNEIIIHTKPYTDFWQRTHYGFSRDNGHCLLTYTDADFLLEVKTRFNAKEQYDQCGLFVRIDKDNWIKESTEFETENHYRLGSVVTNLGFSDWATIDIEKPVNEVWYRIQSKNGLRDFLLEFSDDPGIWRQLRITHLHKATERIAIGIYACSPMNSSFVAKFSEFRIDSSTWK